MHCTAPTYHVTKVTKKSQCRLFSINCHELTQLHFTAHRAPHFRLAFHTYVISRFINGTILFSCYHSPPYALVAPLHSITSADLFVHHVSLHSHKSLPHKCFHFFVQRDVPVSTVSRRIYDLTADSRSAFHLCATDTLIMEQVEGYLQDLHCCSEVSPVS